MARGSLGVLLTLSMNRGDLIILVSQAAWITYSLYSRAAASTLPPVWVMAGANLAAGAVLVPLALLVERPWEDWRAWRGWLVVLYGALPVTLGGETIHAYHVIGALLVAAGVYLATRPVA